LRAKKVARKRKKKKKKKSGETFVMESKTRYRSRLYPSASSRAVNSRANFRSSLFILRGAQKPRLEPACCSPAAWCQWNASDSIKRDIGSELRRPTGLTRGSLCSLAFSRWVV